jgi:hypothetical protein
MKHALVLCMFTSTFALLAPLAHAAPPVKPAAPPREEPARAAAEALTEKPSYWLAAEPHVPLAVVDGKEMRSVGKRGKSCGSANRWAKPKSRWHAVDAWGQISGNFEVAGSELYDVTNCRELTFAARSGKPGAGLFVSEDSSYKPGESAAYAPSVAEKKRFEKFLGAVEGAYVYHQPIGNIVPWGKRTMFFHFAPPKDASWEGRVDGAGKPIERPRHWVVVGGPLLVVGYLGEHGRWHAATVKPPLGLTDSYQPVAVFDMNGDGVPEIVYRSNDGPSYADTVMALSPETMTWADAVESPGGATL